MPFASPPRGEAPDQGVDTQGRADQGRVRRQGGPTRPPRLFAAPFVVIAVVTALAAGSCTAPGAGPGRAYDFSYGGGVAALRLTGDGSRAGPDHVSLGAALALSGYELPSGSVVYAARLGDDGRVVDEFDVAGGATADDFWPASSIKVLAAVGAMEYLRTLGFSGGATVTSADGWSYSVRELARAAISVSENDSYDLLVQIAGVGRLNDVFLSPDNGFPATVIQRDYAGWDLRNSPAMTVSEGDQSMELPPREGLDDYGCPDDGNCSTLPEMVESVRRIVFHRQLPPGQRFAIADADASVLRAALLGTDGWMKDGVAEVLGGQALTYNKPGHAYNCLDVGVVVDISHGDRLMLGLAGPAVGECEYLTELSSQVVRALGSLPAPARP